MTASLETVGDNAEELVDFVAEQLARDLPAFIRHAQAAAYEADGKMNCSYTMTASVKKQLRNEETTMIIECKGRERMPNPVVKRELEFDGQQLRLVGI